MTGNGKKYSTSKHGDNWGMVFIFVLPTWLLYHPNSKWFVETEFVLTPYVEKTTQIRACRGDMPADQHRRESGAKGGGDLGARNCWGFEPEFS
jgi:hypothetical protein